jgi:hypothetical protein
VRPNNLDHGGPIRFKLSLVINFFFLINLTWIGNSLLYLLDILYYSQISRNWKQTLPLGVQGNTNKHTQCLEQCKKTTKKRWEQKIIAHFDTFWKIILWCQLGSSLHTNKDGMNQIQIQLVRDIWQMSLQTVYVVKLYKIVSKQNINISVW